MTVMTPSSEERNGTRMSFLENPRTALATALTSAALIGAGTVAVLTSTLEDEPARTAVAAATNGVPATASTSTLVALYRETSPSVVEITVSASASNTPFGRQSGQGSGFVYDDEGHVITNHHVIAGARSVKVQFSNGKTYDATVVGSDASTDVAVIDVEAPASVLRPLTLADSSRLQVGESVIAIGSPYGLEGTLTTGIISALGRQITAPNKFAIDDAIQTDAAINHGNSGGPLLDLDGKVIGINSQIESESGGNDGIGFAVPSNTVERIAKALIEDGSVEHAYLGVATDASKDGEGAAIAEVRPGTPAAKAGLRAGDVVTKLDGEAITTSDQLRSLVSAHRPGDELELTVKRGDSTLTLDVVLGTRPST